MPGVGTGAGVTGVVPEPEVLPGVTGVAVEPVPLLLGVVGVGATGVVVPLVP